MARPSRPRWRDVAALSSAVPGGDSANSATDERAAFTVVWLFVLLLLGATVLIALDHPARVGDGGGAVAQLRNQRLDVNRASVQELATLPGVGPLLARRIVDDRAERGEFRSIEELDRVSGVGPSLVERVRGKTRVGHP